MIDEFNEYLFDYTSKISIEDIRKAKKKEKKKQVKVQREVVSPYTLERKSNNLGIQILFYIGIVVVVFIVSYFIFSFFGQEDTNLDKDVIAYSITK